MNMVEELFESETFWRDHQPWIESKGYMLRPRYMPNWKPSWEGTNKLRIFCEDWLVVPNRSRIFMDATRMSDGATVAMKKVARTGSELAIAQFFSSQELKGHPSNHCVPILDILSIPDDPSGSILVMPYLAPFDYPPFETVGELVDFFQQIFKGLHFMHAQHIAHRDCCRYNVMMDPSLFSGDFHPVDPCFTKDYKSCSRTKSRTSAPVKYYLIDFGESRYYNPETDPPLDRPGRTQDQTVPEFAISKLSNPFFTDVYLIGNMIKSHVMNTQRGLDFMMPLVNSMTDCDPSRRPTMSQVLARYAKIREKLSASTLRARIPGVDEEEDPLLRIWRQAGHLKRRIKYMLLFVPPIPNHESSGNRRPRRDNAKSFHRIGISKQEILRKGSNEASFSGRPSQTERGSTTREEEHSPEEYVQRRHGKKGIGDRRVG